MTHPKFLVHGQTGRIFSFTPTLNARGDMLGAASYEKACAIARQRTGQAVDDEPFVLSTADKDELEAFAAEQYGVDLDKRKSVAALRAEVAELAQ